MYNEVRYWISWLELFTVSDLADSMYIDVAIAEQFVRAAEHQGIIEKTDALLPGPNGEQESLWRYLPLPAPPRYHVTKPPEWQVTPGVGELAPKDRGIPVPLVDKRKLGEIMSIPGKRQRELRRRLERQRQHPGRD